ncbi:helix-turn-helix transcriptional regulator, partial [Cohnella sp. AR92]|uniref:helix-turn-helix domain-containing protein n=1 Tax=Cohnella sp. AR92 TaxID=648716 RepID=UPI000FAA2A8F
MSFFTKRRKQYGFTIDDLAGLLNWSEDHLRAIDEGNRRPTANEAAELAKLLGGQADDYRDQPNLDEQRILNILKEHGQLPYFGKYDGVFEQAFTWLINDLWKLAKHEGNYVKRRVDHWSGDPEAMYNEIRERFLATMLNEQIDDEFHKERFPFTVYDNGPMTAWVQIFRPNEVADGKLTVVFDSISGGGVINCAEEFISAFCKSYLVPAGLILEHRRKPRYELARFLHLDPTDPTDRKKRYTEIYMTAGGAGFRTGNLELLETRKVTRRVYRHSIRARDFPHPFKGPYGADDRCDDDKIGGCLLY